MFERSRKLLAEWLDNSQRNSGYMCDEKYSEAMEELDMAEQDLTKLQDISKEF